MTRDLKLAALFQALADPTRLRILALLRSMELSVGELAQVLGQSQPRVSRHVKILSDSGLVGRRKEGSWVYLQLADPDRTAPLFELYDGWAGEEAGDLFAADVARLEAVRADRAEAARRYFEAHAATWDSVCAAPERASPRGSTRGPSMTTKVSSAPAMFSPWSFQSRPVRPRP